jgi:hypothetical protein
MIRRLTLPAGVALIGMALMLGLPAAASAATPDVTTFDTYSTGRTTATVEGSVDPNGESTTYAVQYDVANSTWCASGGSSGSPAHEVAGTDSIPFDGFVSIDLSGLAEKTAYCARLIATNGSGTGNGGQVQWTQGAPFTDTYDAFSTDQTTAAVTGDVNSAGQATTYQVQYGAASSTWCTSGGASGSPANSTTPTDLGFTDAAFHDVFVNLSGLTPGTDYCAAVMASNADGAAPVSQVQWTQGAARAITEQAWSTDPTDATVFGGYNPEGSPGTFQVVYDAATSTWCTSGGSTGSPANTTIPTTYSFADTQFNQIGVELTGLTEGLGYCAAMEATNTVGTAMGSQVQWTQGAPGIGTTSASATDATTATVFGNVNPAGQPTSYQVQYDFAGSDWCASGGLVGSPAYTTTSTPLGFSDGVFHEISVPLTGLTEDADYCSQVIATNGDGETDGLQTEWTQTPPPPPPPDVTITVVGPGAVTNGTFGINCSATCSFNIPLNVDLKLTATPAAGATFKTWLGAVTCGPISTTCTVKVSSDTQLTAVFNPPPAPRTHTLAISLGGNGWGTVTSNPIGITCGLACSASFTTGKLVTLTATPSSSNNSVFAGWSGGGCSGLGSCTVTMSADQSLTATFVIGTKPPPIVSCKVPKLRGKKLAAAKTAIKNAHCAVGKITKAYSAKVRKSRVISQKPVPGTKHPAGTKIRLTVSKGPKPS